MPLRFLRLVLPLGFAPLLLYACGALHDGADRAPDVPGDAGAPSDAHDDLATSADAPTDSGSAPVDAGDAAQDAIDASDAATDASSQPTALVLGSSSFHIEGITTDDWVVYDDSARQGIYAVALSGGAPVLIAKDEQVSVWLEGSAVILTSVTTNPNTVTIWTSTTGSHALTDAFDIPQVTLDGKLVGYKQSLEPSDGGLQPYRVAESPLDLSQPVTLATSSAYSIGSAFYVHATLHGFVTGTDSPTLNEMAVDSYAADGTKTHLFDLAEIWVAGEEVLGYSYYGGQSVVASPLTGGPVSITLPGDAGTINQDLVRLTPDGSRVVFADTNGTFWTSPTTTAAVQELPNVAPLEWMVMAPDGSHFLVYTSGTACIASTTPGTAFTVSSPAPNANVVPGFSADGQYAFLYYEHIDELDAVRADQGTTTRLALNLDCNKVFPCYGPGRNSTVLYLAQGDLFEVDPTDAANAKTLGHSINQFVLDASRTVAVYSYKDPASEATSGLFAIGVP